MNLKTLESHRQHLISLIKLIHEQGFTRDAVRYEQCRAQVRTGIAFLMATKRLRLAERMGVDLAGDTMVESNSQPSRELMPDSPAIQS
jgi:hypothetical protein